MRGADLMVDGQPITVAPGPIQRGVPVAPRGADNPYRGVLDQIRSGLREMQADHCRSFPMLGSAHRTGTLIHAAAKMIGRRVSVRKMPDGTMMVWMLENR